ncbi:MAG: hypothetical protein ACREKH_17045 [Candidatus Rokuibacteriota bacterium]
MSALKSCVVSGNRASFFEFPGSSSALVRQLDRVGEWLKGRGYERSGAACVKVVPSKTNKVLASAFGAFGVGVAVIMDDIRKSKFRDLEAGKFSLIDKESDKELLDLIARREWAITT